MENEQTFDEWFETTVSVVDGVARGVVVMLVPMVMVGLAVGLSLRVFKGSVGVFS